METEMPSRGLGEIGTGFSLYNFFSSCASSRTFLNSSGFKEFMERSEGRGVVGVQPKEEGGEGGMGGG